MKRPPIPVRPGFCLALVAAGLAVSATSCRRSGDGGAAGDSAPVVRTVAPELRTNQLAGLPGAVYASQAESPIHWQPWTRVTMERAKDAGRLVFLVLAMPQQGGFQDVLRALEGDPEMLRALNEQYVPVLLDGDASREMSLLMADLCAEINRPIHLPVFVWLTHEANPVAWIPVSSSEPASVRDLFDQSHNMVARTWSDDPGYVLRNSALDNANRRNRLDARRHAKVMSEEPAADGLRCIRQLASLYDPYSRSFDETGGLFPASSIELLSLAAVRPGLPAELRERCMATVRELLTDLLPSPMFDPLDGGVFSARRGATWALPAFTRDCGSQARVAVALMEAHRATGNPLALDRALAVIGFAEGTYATPDGLFAVGLEAPTRPADWLWNIEEIRSLLPEREAGWWIRAAGMKGLGNLPSEADPQREFFRGNTLALAKSPAVHAAESGMPESGFLESFESSRKILLETRAKRLGPRSTDANAHAGSSFRMVSAYAAAFAATGDESYRDKAVKLLERSREAFGTGQHLRAFAVDTEPSLGAGRGFLYALALQSVLDVAAITSDDRWLVWAEDLATTAAELFTGKALLKECPDEAMMVDLPISDLMMLFDDSTAGLVSAVESRLAELGRPLVASFSELAIPLPMYTLDRPVLHTDLLQGTLTRHFRLTVVTGADLPAGLRGAVERLPVRSVQRRPARADEDVPAGSVKILVPGDRPATATTPAELAAALLPGDPD